MEMRFSVGSGVTFGFSAGGSYQPEPEPVPASAVYGTVSGILSDVTGQLATAALYGTATREE